MGGVTLLFTCSLVCLLSYPAAQVRRELMSATRGAALMDQGYTLSPAARQKLDELASASTVSRLGAAPCRHCCANSNCGVARIQALCQSRKVLSSVRLFRRKRFFFFLSG